jgi:TRAP-type C4-dicarboxylate transport system permease small subunit
MLTFIEGIERLLMRIGILSGVSTLLIMLAVTVDVTGRFIFNHPIHGATELSELLLVAMVFFGLALTQQNRQNYAIDILTRHLPPSMQWVLSFLGFLFCLGIVVVLAWFGTRQALDAFDRGEVGIGIIPFPIWPARFILAAGLWMLSLQFVCDILRHVTGSTRVVAEGTGSHE